MSLLGEIMLSISGSNSSIKQVFSILNLILNDCRMKLNHSTIEMQIQIKGNYFNWSEAACDDIINNAVDIYMECCHKKSKTNLILRKRSNRK